MDKELSEALFNEDIKGFTERLAEVRGWVFHQLEYPVIDLEFTQPGRTSLRLRLLCDDWNEKPPSITLLASNGDELTSNEVPTNMTNVFNASSHPITSKPFICTQGSREYHTHTSHLRDQWDVIKESQNFKLSEIITKIWNAWKKGG